MKNSTRFYNLGSSKGLTYILDVKDLSVQPISQKDMWSIIDSGITIGDGDTLTISLKQDGRAFSLYFGNNLSTEIACGRFPEFAEGYDLYSHRISIKWSTIALGYVFVCVGCDVWCKYSIEYPMYMEYIVAIPFGNAKLSPTYYINYHSFITAQFKRPIYLGKRAELESLRGKSVTEFPKDVFCLELPKTVISNSAFILYGRPFNKVPFAEEVTKYIPFV